MTDSFTDMGGNKNSEKIKGVVGAAFVHPKDLKPTESTRHENMPSLGPGAGLLDRPS